MKLDELREILEFVGKDEVIQLNEAELVQNLNMLLKVYDLLVRDEPVVPKSILLGQVKYLPLKGTETGATDKDVAKIYAQEYHKAVGKIKEAIEFLRNAQRTAAVRPSAVA